MKKDFIYQTFTCVPVSFASEAEGGRVNPLLKESDAPYQAIPFDKINDSDFEEAITEGISLHEKEIDAIADSEDAPTFENTIAAMDRSGVILNRAILTLGNLENATGAPALMSILQKMTPLLSKHDTGILLNESLWQRVKSVYESRETRKDLTAEDLRLIEETYRGFAQSGANLRVKTGKDSDI